MRSERHSSTPVADTEFDLFLNSSPVGISPPEVENQGNAGDTMGVDGVDIMGKTTKDVTKERSENTTENPTADTTLGSSPLIVEHQGNTEETMSVTDANKTRAPTQDVARDSLMKQPTADTSKGTKDTMGDIRGDTLGDTPKTESMRDTTAGPKGIREYIRDYVRGNTDEDAAGDAAGDNRGDAAGDITHVAPMSDSQPKPKPKAKSKSKSKDKKAAGTSQDEQRRSQAGSSRASVDQGEEAPPLLDVNVRLAAQRKAIEGLEAKFQGQENRITLLEKDQEELCLAFQKAVGLSQKQIEGLAELATELDEVLQAKRHTKIRPASSPLLDERQHKSAKSNPMDYSQDLQPFYPSRSSGTLHPPAGQFSHVQHPQPQPMQYQTFPTLSQAFTQGMHQQMPQQIPPQPLGATLPGTGYPVAHGLPSTAQTSQPPQGTVPGAGYPVVNGPPSTTQTHVGQVQQNPPYTRQSSGPPFTTQSQFQQNPPYTHQSSGPPSTTQTHVGQIQQNPPFTHQPNQYRNPFHAAGQEI